MAREAAARTTTRGPVPGTPAREAVAAMADRHGGRLYALARRLCDDPAQAEDLVQETFLQALRAWPRFRGGSDPGTWLWTIAARTCARFHRRRRGEPRRILSIAAEDPFSAREVAAPPEGGIDGEARREAVERLEGAIVDLPASLRLPLVLRDVAGMDVAAASRALGISAGAFKVRTHRARMALRAAMSGALPRRPMPPPAYTRRVCLDLLRARQDALDRGVPFPLSNSLVCERCRAVFDTLGLGAELCAEFGNERMPQALRAAIRAADAGPPPGRRGRA